MRKMVLILTLLVMVTACTGTPEDQGEIPSPFAITGSSEPAEGSSTPTPSPSSAPPAAARLSSTQVESPRFTPTPAIGLCSPLALHPFEELPDIIGDAYQPPRPGREERHHGIDFGYYHYQDRDSMLGELVQSILPGRVAAVLNDLYPYGNMVMVETTWVDIPETLVEGMEIPANVSLYILYAHMDQPPLVELGELVDSCQPLGEVGMSGNTDIPHLHIETRLGPTGHTFESMRYYDTRATVEELAAYELWRTSGEFQHFDPMLLLGEEAKLEEITKDDQIPEQ